MTDIPGTATRVGALAGLCAIVAGCGNTPERLNAHQSRDVDRTPPEIYAMPDHYNNVAAKCDGHGHRIYVTSNKDPAPSNMVVISDRSCGR
jgi:hypothetical protein